MSYRYITATDGTALAFRGWGEGSHIVLTNGLASSEFYWQGLLPRLSQHSRVVAWDLKGHGASEPAHDPAAATIEASVDDLRRVLDAEHASQAVLVGFSMGCQIVLEAYRCMPERIRALVLILGTFEYPFDHLLHPSIGPHLGRLLQRVPLAAIAPLFTASAFWAPRTPGLLWLNKQLGIVGENLGARDMQPFFSHLGQLHAPTWLALARSAATHSARSILPTVAVPSLVIVGGRDGFTPAHQGRTMAQAIPGAELFTIPAATHTGLLEYPELIVDRMQHFFAERQVTV